MNFLIDTCVISELIKKEPNKNLIKWINNVDESNFFVSVLTIGEIKKGISKLPDISKKQMLNNWLYHDLLQRFNGKILLVNMEIAFVWGEICGLNEASGFKLPSVDALIAATAICNKMTLVTRNTKDFVKVDCLVFNPWDDHC